MGSLHLSQPLARTAAFLAGSLLMASAASAFFVDGSGKFGLRGESRTVPGFNGSTAHQAIDQFFQLRGELRANDRASMITEFRLFPDPRSAYAGDTSGPVECSPLVESGQDRFPANTGNADDCTGRNQNSAEPAYADLMPRVSQFYALYSADFCLLKAGRRARHWGMGVYLDDGSDLFDTSASIYDGITCDINVQKSQTLGMSVGYDKIQETGAPVNHDKDDDTSYGPRNQTDDLDQIFFTIMYDDRKANAGQGFTRQIGFYLANILGRKPLKSDVKIADLFLGFYLPSLVIQQEFIFRLGKSSDPSYTRLGGKASLGGETATNNVQSIAAAGGVEYIFDRSGSMVGPARYRQGDATSHSLFFDYAWAPGDADGYRNQIDDDLSLSRSDANAKAIAFNRNFKPALILFNGRQQQDDLRTDGVFDPGRVMNATVFSLGYRYRSLDTGNFEVKLISASLNETIPADMKADFDTRYAADNTLRRPFGYEGADLGYELDLTYDLDLAENLLVGGALAAASPGEAWKGYADRSPDLNLLVQGWISFTF